MKSIIVSLSFILTGVLSQNCYSQFMPPCDSVIFYGKRAVSDWFYKDSYGLYIYLRETLILRGDSTYKHTSLVCEDRKCNKKSRSESTGTWKGSEKEITLTPQYNEKNKIVYLRKGDRLKEKPIARPKAVKKQKNVPVVNVRGLPGVRKFKRQEDCS